jgi:hypothetical protein
MPHARPTWWERLRRPAALAAAAAVVAILAPASPATAAVTATVTLSAPVAGAERIDRTATYDLSCDFDGPTERAGGFWALSSSTGRAGGGELALVDDGLHRSGQFTIDYAALPAGSYTITAACYTTPSSSVWTTRSVTLGDVATSTTVVSPGTVVLGQQSTLAATVVGVPAGQLVHFALGEDEIGTAPVDASGRAQISYAFTTSGTVYARFLGSEGFAPSGSLSSVTVLSDVVAGTYSYAPRPTVGTRVPFDTSGWSPSPQQGLALAYAWSVGGEVVSREETFTPSAEQVGQELSVTVTGSHPLLAPGTAKSLTTVIGTVERGTIAEGHVSVEGTVDGQAVLGQPLVARASGWTGATVSYQWFIGDDEFSRPGDTYTPAPADLGRSIRLRATVTAPGMTTVWDDAWVRGSVATPAVTVGSSSVTVGRDAVVPVTVAGPAGAPVPAGEVQVTLTPRAGGDPVVLDPASLTGGGTASVTVAGLAVGTYDVVATYLPGSSPHAAYSAPAATDLPSDPYRTATGSGTVTVTKAAVGVRLDGALTVAVATRGELTAAVTGAAAGQAFVVREGGSVLGRGTVAAGGGLTFRLPVLAVGAHDVVVELPETATTLASSATARVTVLGEPPRVGALPTAALDTPKAATAPGQQMELVAEGFQPGETVAFYLHSDPVFLGTAVAGADGVARLLATVPADVPAGAHTVYATGGTTGRWATLAVELAVPGAAAAPAAGTGAPAAAAPAAAASDLAVTGAQSGGALAAAWLLLLGGAGLVVLARRARASR